jgi:hypothetical protein
VTKRVYAIKKCALIGLLAATITGGKLALMAIANVEIVTLLIMLYAVVFGLAIALPATLIFVTTEVLLFGAGTWVISYYFYWPFLAIAFALYSKLTKDNTILRIVFVIVITTFFGVFTTLVDTIFFLKAPPSTFLRSFAIMYSRGVSFFIVHIVGNTLFSIVAFGTIKTHLQNLKKAYFGDINPQIR